MLDGADVTDVDNRESIVELAAYWPLVFSPLSREKGGGGGGGGGWARITFSPRVVSGLLFASLFGKCLMEQTRW